MSDARTRARRMLGWTLTVLAISFLVLDAAMKLLALPPALQANAALGFEGVALTRTLGVILACCTVLYAIPRTAALGAVLLTGHLGGAVAAHLRVGDPLFTHVLFGVYLGALLWGALCLRDPALVTMLFPWTRNADAAHT